MYIIDNCIFFYRDYFISAELMGGFSVGGVLR